MNAPKNTYYEKGCEGVDSFPLAQDKEKGWGRYVFMPNEPLGSISPSVRASVHSIAGSILQRLQLQPPVRLASLGLRHKSGECAKSRSRRSVFLQTER